MGWIGKIVGGALGLAIGGPLGLVAGIAFGNLFDRSTNIGRTQKAPTYTQTQHSQMVYFVATFSMLAKMATANGRFVPEERKVIEDYMTHKLKLDPSSKEAAWRVFNAALSGQGTFEEYAQQFYESFAHERAHLEVMLDVLVGIAAADGKIDPSEERLINRAASIFRISASLLDAIKKRYTN
ncbi:MAG: TerB family tellurite resistance protein, partial [Sphaerochaetaceae bacterium]|nr:TerB family tellurite resistance protein [Sphaerochaetaceae bacterium]